MSENTAWTPANSTAAAAQGWQLIEVWEQRLMHEVMRHDSSNIFTTDEAARVYVRERARKGDPLAALAMRLIFLGKVGPTARKKA